MSVPIPVTRTHADLTGRIAAASSAAPDVETMTVREERTITVPRYHVVLLDDDDHTYEYVIEMLVSIFGHSARHAYDLATRVDREGRVVVDTTTKERADLKCEQIRSYGPDWRISHSRTSMGATVERAD